MGKVRSIFPYWVLDVTNYKDEDPVFCWCPINPDTGEIIVGMTYIGECPGTKYGVVHFDGKAAVDEFMKTHPDIEAMFET